MIGLSKLQRTFGFSLPLGLSSLAFFLDLSKAGKIRLCFISLASKM
jgi:hypothetical protein